MDENDELQSADYEAPVEESNEYDADPDQHLGADSATASEPGHEENAEGEAQEKPVNQEAINEAINRQHAKYREEQRKRMALEEELQRVRGSVGQVNDPEPTIPEIDPYGDDLDEQVKQRDEALRAHIAWQQRQAQQRAQMSQYEQARYLEQQQLEHQKTEQFLNSAQEFNVDQSELVQAVHTVGQYQLGQTVAQYLMSDDRGPLLTTTLAKQPALLAELSMMQPHEAILHIERNVRSRLNAQPRTSRGKAPPTRVKGRAADASDKYPLTGGKVRIK